MRANPGIPQAKQIRDAVAGRARQRGPIRVLDFGAGKGRLLANLKSLRDEGDPEIDYRAYDRSQADRDACLEVICGHYEDAESGIS